MRSGKPERTFWNHRQLATAATIIIAASAEIAAEATAEEKDYNKNDNPGSSTAAVVTTATHNRTSLRFSKSYYEKQRNVLQILSNKIIGSLA